MMHIRNFSYYTPAEPDVAGAMYLKSEDGQDWYECQALFSPETLKVVYDSRGVITGYGKETALLWPVNQSVAEVPDTPESRKIDL
ncbi:phage tail protein, partial [Escherichia coli]|nr:tail fiber assembly protein [Escherichia coli]EJK5870203.1 phage tail protein [Escherichia coli]EJO4580847.1 phage tail protein [Escherichia coli]